MLGKHMTRSLRWAGLFFERRNTVNEELHEGRKHLALASDWHVDETAGPKTVQLGQASRRLCPHTDTRGGSMRGKRKGYDKHHRRPKSRGGTGHERNISLVDKELHSCWHKLFDNYSPETIAAIISELWLDPDWELVAVRKDELPEAEIIEFTKE